MLPLVFIFGGVIGCSVGTDKSAPMPEKSLSQISNMEGSSFKSENKTLSAKLPKGSTTKANGHARVTESKIIHRKILVPSEVEGKWDAAKLLVRNK